MRTEVQARSVILATLGKNPNDSSEENSLDSGNGSSSDATSSDRAASSGNFLVVGFGDGGLNAFPMRSDNNQDGVKIRICEEECRNTNIGTKSLHLDAFITSSNSSCIWAGGESPTVLHYSKGKLSFSVINTTETYSMASFNSALFPSCVATVGPNGLLISVPDALQKLHVVNYPLHNLDPRRICYHSRSCTVVVAGTIMATFEGIDSQYAEVRFLDANSGNMEAFHSFHLDPLEEPLCLHSLPAPRSDALEDGSGGTQARAGSTAEKENADRIYEEWVLVGTVYVAADGSDVEKGRILVFKISGNVTNASGTPSEGAGSAGRTVSLIGTHTTDGPVYALAPPSNYQCRCKCERQQQQQQQQQQR